MIDLREVLEILAVNVCIAAAFLTMLGNDRAFRIGMIDGADCARAEAQGLPPILPRSRWRVLRTIFAAAPLSDN